MESKAVAIQIYKCIKSNGKNMQIMIEKDDFLKVMLKLRLVDFLIYLNNWIEVANGRTDLLMLHRTVRSFQSYVFKTWKGRINYRDQFIGADASDSGHEHQIYVLKELLEKCLRTINRLNQSLTSVPVSVSDTTSVLPSHADHKGLFINISEDNGGQEKYLSSDNESLDEESQDEESECIEESSVSESTHQQSNDDDVDLILDDLKVYDTEDLKKMLLKKKYESCDYFYWKTSFHSYMSKILYFWCAHYYGVRPIISCLHDCLEVIIEKTDFKPSLRTRLTSALKTLQFFVPITLTGFVVFDTYIDEIFIAAKLTFKELPTVSKLIEQTMNKNSVEKSTEDEKNHLHVRFTSYRSALRYRCAIALSSSLAQKRVKHLLNGKQPISAWKIINFVPNLSLVTKEKISKLSVNFDPPLTLEQIRMENPPKHLLYPLKDLPINFSPHSQTFIHVLVDEFELEELWQFGQSLCPELFIPLEWIAKALLNPNEERSENDHIMKSDHPLQRFSPHVGCLTMVQLTNKQSD